MNGHKLSEAERIKEIIQELKRWVLGNKLCPLVGVSRLEKAQASLDILVYEEKKEKRDGPT